MGRGKGRPTKFTPELGAEICLRITAKPFPENSLTRICKDEDMPCRTTVYMWILNAAIESASVEEKDFLNRYNTAHLIKIDNMYDESFEIAYDDADDILENEKGYIGNSTNVARARLKVDLIKWALSKLNPKKYGDKIQTELSGTVTTMTAHEKMMLEMIEKNENRKK
jgi:hypothetical protein